MRKSFCVPSAIAISTTDAFCKNEINPINHSGQNEMPMPPSEYVCFSCRKNNQTELTLVKAKTTLVMTPLHITIQWINELHKHLCHDPHEQKVINKYYCKGQTNKIRYLMYPGISTILRNKKTKKSNHFLLTFIGR